MIIGIDGNEANVENRVGVSAYTLNLLKYFNKQSNKDLRFKIYLRNSPLPNLPKQNKFFQYKIVPGKILWSQIYLPLELHQKKDIDVFFSPAHYIPRFCPVPTIVTIHDLAYLYFEKDFLRKDLYQLKNWTKYSVNKAAKIIAVSKTTKKDLINSYNVSEEKIKVIYNGYEKQIKKLEIGNLKFNENWKLEIENYILFVGTLQPRKNIDTLIEAFIKFRQIYPEFKLFIAGKSGWLYKKKIYNGVYYLDYVTDSQLKYLYKNAICLVLPSFYEGFGLPLLEAMNNDCPVISSFSSSLPEIGGDAALYFDPKKSEELVEKLKLIKNDGQLRDELIKKGRKRIKDFSWKKCGKETLDVIKKTYASATI